MQRGEAKVTLKEVEIGAVERRQIQEQLPHRMQVFAGKRIAVLGDIGLDEYVWGDVRRISPEAPVPVVEVNRQDKRLGLAANVAQNVASLGGEPLLLALVGADSAAEEMKGLLRTAQVSTDSLLVDPERPTTHKMRIMSEHHHIVRVDFERRQFLSPQMELKLLGQLKEILPSADALIIEDYAKGLLSENTIQQAIGICHSLGKKVMVDPHPQTPLNHYRGADLMTPNREEAIHLSGLEFDELRARPNWLLEVGQSLRVKGDFPQLIITRGKEGMSLFAGETATHLPTYARQVFDVTGAGDTVIAALALAWSSGASLEEACVLANFAAGVVVGKVGCVPCSPQELIEYMHSHAD